MYRIGIDLGGTNIAAGVVDESQHIVAETSVPTGAERGAEAVVADICAGSGTTAVAALNTGRRFVCFESAPAFYGPATERIRRAQEAVASGGKGE